MFNNKTKQLIVVAAVIFHSMTAAKNVNGKKKSKSGKKSAASDFGYLQARDVWVSGGHGDGCTFESGASTFWSNKVCSTVFTRCDDNYKFIPDMIKECKDGNQGICGREN